MEDRTRGGRHERARNLRKRAGWTVAPMLAAVLVAGCGDEEPAAQRTVPVTVVTTPIPPMTVVPAEASDPTGDLDGDGVVNRYDPEPRNEKVGPPDDEEDEVPDASSAESDLEVALADLDARVDQVSGSNILVEATTPSGGFEGASTGDLNRAAGAIFTAIYRDTVYRRPVVILFRGGLVDTKTGADVPDVKTGQFRMSRRDASAVDWDAADEIAFIEWGNFREFAHPAIKQDE